MIAPPTSLDFLDQMNQFIALRQQGKSSDSIAHSLETQMLGFWKEKTLATADQLIESHQADAEGFRRLKEEVENVSLKEARDEVEALQEATRRLDGECSSLNGRLKVFEQELAQRIKNMAALQTAIRAEATRRLPPTQLESAIVRGGRQLCSTISYGNPYSYQGKI